LRRVFKLGNIQKYVLYNLILSTYERLGDLTPTFNDVFITLTNIIESSSPKDGFLSKDVLNSLIPYLDLLRSQYLTTTSIIPEELFSGLTVVDLSTVDSDFLRGIYIESLLYVVNTYMKSANKPLFLIVDEAHRFMGGKVAPLLSKLVVEGRKFGVTLVVITQHPLDLDPNIIGNSAYIVTFSIQEVNNLNYISRVLSSGYIRYEVIRNIITNLKSYEALVKVRDDKNLYVIKA
jgi:DNA helicase HerA-like ATPase